MLVAIIIVVVLFFLNIFITDSNQLINQITHRIPQPWLKTTLRIILKIIIFSVLTIGALATIFIAIVMAYDSEKGKKK